MFVCVCQTSVCICIAVTHSSFLLFLEFISFASLFILRYVALTGRIFARRGLSTVLPDLVSIAMGHSIFANAALQDGLEKAFGGKHNTFGDFPLLPKFFVTAFGETMAMLLFCYCIIFTCGILC